MEYQAREVEKLGGLVAEFVATQLDHEAVVYAKAGADEYWVEVETIGLTTHYSTHAVLTFVGFRVHAWASVVASNNRAVVSSDVFVTTLQGNVIQRHVDLGWTYTVDDNQSVDDVLAEVVKRAVLDTRQLDIA